MTDEDYVPMAVSLSNGYQGNNSAFLSQAPFTSCEICIRSRSRLSSRSQSRPGTMTRAKTAHGHSSMSLQLSPFLFRRSATITELPPLTPSTRVKSARQSPSGDHSIMPRSNVSVARFYDWSEDLGDCFSVSRLYREIASIPRPTDKQQQQARLATQLGTTSGINSVALPVQCVAPRMGFTSPGRMFVRDKKALTRGEKEIIEGIYKNRGDINPKEAAMKSEFQVKSHLEAWYAGKQNDSVSSSGRGPLRGERIDGKQLKTNCSCSEIDKTSSANRSAVISEQQINDADCANLSSPRGGDSSQHKSHHHAPTHYAFGKPKPPPNLPGTAPASLTLSSTSYNHKDTSEAHDLAKQTMKVQSRDGYWDTRPCAPPSTPDHNTGSHRTVIQPAPTFDKILDHRARLSPNSNTFFLNDPNIGKSSTGRLYDRGDEHTNGLAYFHNGYPVDSEDSYLFRYQSRDNTLESKESTCTDDSDYGQEKHNKNGAESDDATKKRLRVNVYLPVAGPEPPEELVPSMSPLVLLTKERPLSHTEYKQSKCKLSESSDETLDSNT